MIDSVSFAKRFVRILGGGAEDVFVRLGEPIEVEATVEDISEVQFFLSNEDFGGPGHAETARLQERRELCF